ncbi:uncharacterized protein LOC132261325 isoform X2 [Phlebotomus argentipes]|uniref:uncharacterized protein LOC132261325 isoform X2 n=1 Tax=Phlebotomus argentipes TaxID=94469 RepID=UPI00289348EE|nr:uncharacterized protein LOC132261325 isoform X2 [Phlebotomus argentipes]
MRQEETSFHGLSHHKVRDLTRQFLPSDTLKSALRSVRAGQSLMRHSASEMAKILLIFLIVSLASGQTPSEKPPTLPVTYGSPFDEIIVESSLNIRRKPTPVRQTRSLAEMLSGETSKKLRRDDGNNFPSFENFGSNFGNFGSSSALANAHAQNQFFDKDGFGGSAANAGAQAFESHGPLGSFGASASNAQSQGFNGSAGLSGGQTYNLPNGQTFSFTYGNTVSFGPDGKPTVSRSNSVAFS